jgi:hypothetical protein
MTNFINQTLAGLPTFCLALLILTYGYKRYGANRFLLCASTLAVIQFITNEIFWFNDPNTGQLQNFLTIVNIVFAPTYILFLYGVLQVMVEKNASSTSSRQSVWILVILCIVTLGFYIPYWYIRQGEKYGLQKLLVVPFVVLIVLMFDIHIYMFAERNAFHEIVWLSIDVLTAALGIYLSFNLRENILKTHDDIVIDPVLTFLLGIFYLQYVINWLEGAQAPVARPK